MEDIIKDFLWFEYEGRIILEIFNKCTKALSWQKGNKNFRQALIEKLFRPEDIRKFYLLGHAVSNISPLFNEEWANLEMLITRYGLIQEDNYHCPVKDFLFEYQIWKYTDNIENYKILLSKFENKTI